MTTPQNSIANPIESSSDWLLTVPRLSQQQGILVSPNGNGMATSYSLVYDVYFPKNGSSGWMPFLQTDLTNISDGDIFGKVGGDSYGVGISGNYRGAAKLDAWNRIGLTIETDANGAVSMKKYINGEFVANQKIDDGAARFTIDTARGFLIFADEDGETSPSYLSNFLFIQKVLTNDEMSYLGAPKTSGILPDQFKQEAEKLGGLEVRFAEGSAKPVVGTGTITGRDTTLEITTAAKAGIPAIGEKPAVDPAAVIRTSAIQDMMVTPDAANVTIDLSKHFAGENLTFTVQNSKNETVSAVLTGGNKLTLDFAAFGHSDIRVTATDSAGKSATDDFRVRVAGPNAYTIAVVPDTQDYTYLPNGDKTLNGMFDWLVKNSEALNIRFVTQVGDVTQNNTADEWVIAKAAYSKLDGKIPYAMVPGNHDQGLGAKNYTSLITDSFSPDYLRKNSTLGGVYDQEPNETKNAWYTFTGADNTKWIVLTLEFGARDDVLRWAGEVLAANVEYRAIVTTHHYTNMANRADNYSHRLFGEGTGKNYGIGTNPANANDGEDMWQKLISKHPNVSFVFSGHVFGDGAETVVALNDAGKPVYQMLVNYQDGVATEVTGNGDASRGGNGGNGAIRLVTIDPDNNTVMTSTYLSALDEYLTGSRGDSVPSRDGKGAEAQTANVEIQAVTFSQENIDGVASGIITAPKFNPLNGLKLTPGFTPSNGGSTFDNYTIVMDVRLPKDGGGLASIFQSDLSNKTDGDLWLNYRGTTALIGTDNRDEGAVPLDAWTRIVIAVERNPAGGYTLHKYADGKLMGSQPVGATYDISAAGFLLFADDSAETAAFSMSSVAFLEKTLSAGEVSALGKVTAQGPFPSEVPGTKMVQFDFSNGTMSPTVGSGTLSQNIGGDPRIQPVVFGQETVGDAASGIITAPQFDGRNGLKVTPGFNPKNGGSTFDNYSIVMDVKLPKDGASLASIFQSDLSNVTDGDLWLNYRGATALIGTDNRDEGAVPLDVWTRIVISVERNPAGGYTLHKYADGKLMGSQPVGATYDIGSSGFLLFADNDKETAPFSLSSVAFLEKTLSSAEVAALGTVTSKGPFQSTLSGVNMVQFDFSSGTFAPSFGTGSLSQKIGTESSVQLTGAYREHQETITGVDLGTPDVQFVARAGNDQTVTAATGLQKIKLVAANVDKLGQIASVEWLNENGEIVGRGTNVEVELGGGVHRMTLVARSDKGVVSTDDVKIAVKTSATLLHDNFDDGNANGWSDAGAKWQVVGSATGRQADANATIAAPEGALRAYRDADGLKLWQGEGSRGWSGYTLSATILSEDNKPFGLVAYYTDPQNYYLLSFDIASNRRELVKMRDGVRTVLASEQAGAPFDRDGAVKLAIDGGRLFASLDGEVLFGGVVEDRASPLSGGSVGLWANQTKQVFFDDIFVEKGAFAVDAGRSIRLVDGDGDGKVAVDLVASAKIGASEAARFVWSEQGAKLADGAKSRVELSQGTHLVRVDMTDAGRNASDTVTVEIIAAKNVLLSTSFADGKAANFRFVDEGELGAAAKWDVVNGALVQSANRYSRELGGNGDTAPTAEWNLSWSALGDGIYALRKGTYALYEGAGSDEWSDYSVETGFVTQSGAVGLLLHYRNDGNYIKFEIDNRTGLSQLFSMKDGIEQTLWQGPAVYKVAAANTLRADIVDDRLQVWLNGEALFTKAIGIDGPGKGTFGLYNWRAGQGVAFDDVLVTLPSGKAVTIPEAGQITGTSGNDMLIGSPADETMFGNDGNDELQGFGGNDRLDGGAGDDALAGGAGNDALSGSGGNDALWGDAGNDMIAGGFGDDFIEGGKGNDLLIGGDGSDRYRYGRGDGSDDIVELASASGAIDRLSLHDIARSEAVLRKYGQSVEIELADGEKLTLRNQLADGGIERLSFADGTVLNRDDILKGLVNRGPAAANDRLAAVNEDAPSFIISFATLLGNDRDADLDGLTVTGVSAPVGGTAVLEEAGIRFTLAADFNGEAAFRYSIADGRGGSSEATAAFTVKPVNDAPVVSAATAGTDEDKAVSGRIVASDVDGDRLTFALKGDAANGTARINAETGEWTYTPRENVNGTGSFTVLVSDGMGGVSETTVTIAIKPVNDAPVAVADAVVVGEKDRGVFDLVANDTDIEGDRLTLTSVAVTAVAGLALTKEQAAAAFSVVEGKLVVDPSSAFAKLEDHEQATVTLTYTVRDANGGESTGTTTVTVDGYTEYNIVEGSDGDDVLIATDGKDMVDGGDGDDRLSAGGGHDMVDAGDGNDRVIAGEGSDDVYGGAGNDVLMGGAGNDVLYGGSGNDELGGGSGHDVLAGGSGNDVLTGGSGVDTFVFAAGAGRDVVTDFQVGLDFVRLSKDVFADYQAFIASGAFTDGENGAQIALKDGSTITFDGVKTEQFVIDDFRFA
ncbi:Ig-like domain-containing protein [Agrobacterium sp. NPDC090283]|uniref:Ig-like domain-containing protein n=1 Tax=Agrobacterium sp. NPDC090283 TaxID=3363920 RepID=UPI00383B9E71